MQLALAGALMGHKQLSFARVRVMQHHLRGLTKMVLLVILRACACDAAHTSGPTESVAPVILRACACDAAAGGDNMAMPCKSHLNAI